MQYKDQIIRMTQQQVDSYMKAVRAMPEDKLNWSVQDTSRTALDITQEIAQCPLYVIPMLQNRACPPFNPEEWGRAKAEREQWGTIDDCERILKENLEKFYAEVRAFPEEELSLEIDLPFVEGMRQSMADIIAYPYWNLSYHLGQVSFIQILYGDMDMR